ncbi:diguanylate cyclase (GGDEF) domain-containing protein [Granulicella rosea]|uniref:Diguanylate cyclase (GGDEF) domain-containing protein n=1 Tax=Granulicella rosea TaxID=474952 RepID=A0A239DNY9_9BACT|nr:GGDEF domain-containing protein [Granulicella rosea]SNS33608.1 diguanylate cyclase (GGDEF) domain-containing protein [Granulicella rosea]
MRPEQLINLPNTAALVLLIVMLLVLRHRESKLAIGSWLVAMSLVLASQVAWYFAKASGPQAIMVHTFRLCADMLAGVVLLLFTGWQDEGRSGQTKLLAWNAVPFLALELLYGLQVYRPEVFVACAAGGAVVCLAVGFALCRRWPYVVWQLLLWCAVGAFGANGNFRAAAYWGLGFVYSRAAFHLWFRLGRGQLGRLMVVGSLAVWSTSFFLHPWLLQIATLRPLAESIWAMQRFAVPIGMLVILLEDAMRENKLLALHDQLTGLPNRRFMEQSLLAAVQSGRAGVLLLDLNGFKAVNDRHGHLAGDLLLRQIAVRLRRLADAEDTVVRMGGDEYLIVSNHDLESLALAVRAAVREPVRIDEEVTVSVQASVGTASFPEDTGRARGEDAVTELIRVADRRMYAAKESGKANRGLIGTNDRRTTPRSA